MGYKDNNTRTLELALANWSLKVRLPNDISAPHLPSSVMEDACFDQYLEAELHYIPDTDGLHAAQFDRYVAPQTPFLPRSIEWFYRSLYREGVSFLAPERHVNQYYYINGLVYARFPYSNDGFRLICDNKHKQVWLIGPPHSLRRVLFDLYSITRTVLPVHGSAVEFEGQAMCFLGNSGSGKTLALQMLLAHGGNILSDDALLIEGNVVHACERFISVRDSTLYKTKRFEEVCVGNNAPQDCVPLGLIYVLHDKEPFIQWFPAVARQSVWWLVLHDEDEALRQHVQDKVHASVLHVQRLIAQGRNVQIDISEAIRQIEGAPLNMNEAFKPFD